jgi:hypothetical protein
LGAAQTQPYYSAAQRQSVSPQAIELNMVSGFQILDIQSQVGHALWQIQALEKTLIHFIVLGFKVSRGTDPLKAEEQFSVFDRFTLGRLISDIEKNTDTPEKLKKRLPSFLPKRNWLVHKSWSDHFQHLPVSERLSVYSNKVLQIGDQALELNKQFADLLEQKILAAGVLKSLLDQETNKLLAKWFVG